MLPLVLASQSPRRRELLGQLEDSFEICSPDIDEGQKQQESPPAYVRRLAIEKARVGSASCHQPSVVLGSDTIVVQQQQLLGKPTDKAHFLSMMAQLSGAHHQVYTGVAVVSPTSTFSCVVVTEVQFCTLSTDDMEWYWQTEEPRDKAGGYGIQGLGARFVERINGSYSAVVGLPLYETRQLLKKIREESP